MRRRYKKQQGGTKELLTVLFRPSPLTKEQQRELFESHMKASYRQSCALAYRLTGNAHEAEDLVQETYVRAFRFFHRYDENLPFTSWIYRIMTNVHIDMVRRQTRLRTTSLDQGNSTDSSGWELPDHSAAPDKDLMSGSFEEPVRLALRALSPDFRTAVVLADVEGMAYEEIAETMQISVGTVRSRIHRGRKQIRRYLEQNYPQLTPEGGQ